MNAGIWRDLYRSLQKPQMEPVMTGFNANIDRSILVTPEMLASFEQGAVKGFDAILPRLKQSMRSCSADEIFISNPARYRELSEYFSRYGTLSVGGQAGIAAVHLKRLGIPSVTCVVPSAGPETCTLLEHAGVTPLTFQADAGDRPDSIHLVFEYPPGLVPLANGIVPRSNRFIVSPLHNPSSVVLPETSVQAFRHQISVCRRAFLSGYQYLQTEQEFVIAARQIRMIRRVHPRMRTHVECVSGADRPVMALMFRYIFPYTDSIGLNERELGLFMDVVQRSSPAPAAIPVGSPAACIRDAIALADVTGVSRIHLHTFGYYILIRKSENTEPEVSRNALLLASQVAVGSGGIKGAILSEESLLAYTSVRDAYGPDEMTGIFSVDGYVVIIVPTLISRNIQKTAGLGDIISSTAFVADHF